MKAKVADRSLLTIGMIVKNEEKHLEKCLQALRPLRDAIPCELIIADTGSTDCTIGIARRYADDVFDFEWIDDFAAARNAVVERASGEWYLSLDADEYLDEDVSELASFLKSGKRGQYLFGECLIRNYIDPDDSSFFADAYVRRLFRPGTGLRFINPIHETLPLVEGERIWYCDTVIHHYGYRYSSPEEKNRKLDRNMKLIEMELERDPDNFRLICEAMDAARNDRERKLYTARALEVARRTPEAGFSRWTYYQAMTDEINRNQWWTVVDLGKEYADRFPESIADVDVFYLLTVAQYSLGDYQEAREAGEHFQKLYDQPPSSADKEIMRAFSVSRRTPYYKNEMACILFHCYAELEDYAGADKMLAQLDPFCLPYEHCQRTVNRLLQSLKKGLSLHFEGFYRALSELEHHAKAEQRMKMRYLCNAVSELFADCETEPNRSVLDQFARLPGDDRFLELIRLVLKQENGELPLRFPECWSLWSGDEDVFPGIYYLALRNKMPPPRETIQLSSGKLQALGDSLLASFTDFPDVLLDALDARDTWDDQAAEAVFYLGLLEQVAARLDKERCGELMMERTVSRYAKLMGAVLRRTFQPGLLCEENVWQLPERYQCGFWICEALDVLRSDGKRYLYCLKKAVQVDIGKKNLVDFLIERFEKQEETKSEQAREFQRLAAAVKAEVRALITKGETQEAAKVLAQLRQLTPGDEELDELLALLPAGSEALS